MSKKRKTQQPSPPARRGFGRRQILTALGGLGVAAIGATFIPGLFNNAPANAAEVTVYKSPSCGCCGKWVDHLRRNGFRVSVTNVDDLDPVKKRAGVPYALESCHTAFVDGYVVEGHVPAENIHKILADRPKIIGLSVPGMPTGSPGMEGSDREHYKVYSFAAKGRSKVFASY